MTCIQWTEQLSVNVKKIDDQHKTLVEKINALHDAMKANKGREVQKAIIDGMVEYAAIHFQTEENYMRLYNYPGYEQHRKEHEVFTQKAIDLQERVKKSGFVLTLEILNFLREWLQAHILGTDKQYSRHFNENGLR